MLNGIWTNATTWLVCVPCGVAAWDFVFHSFLSAAGRPQNGFIWWALHVTAWWYIRLPPYLYASIQAYALSCICLWWICAFLIPFASSVTSDAESYSSWFSRIRSEDADGGKEQAAWHLGLCKQRMHNQCKCAFKRVCLSDLGGKIVVFSHLFAGFHLSCSFTVFPPTLLVSTAALHLRILCFPTWVLNRFRSRLSSLIHDSLCCSFLSLTPGTSVFMTPRGSLIWCSLPRLITEACQQPLPLQRMSVCFGVHERLCVKRPDCCKCICLCLPVSLEVCVHVCQVRETCVRINIHTE